MRRVVLPPGLVILIMVISSVGYTWSIHVAQENLLLASILANVGALLMFISIWLGAFIAHPMALRAGASFGERILVCLIPPFAWATKEMVGAACIYSGF
ncbi:MAG: hypothetical protein ACP5G0_14480, partial [Desulfomonilia bacterium]